MKPHWVFGINKLLLEEWAVQVGLLCYSTEAWSSAIKSVKEMKKRLLFMICTLSIEGSCYLLQTYVFFACYIDLIIFVIHETSSFGSQRGMGCYMGPRRLPQSFSRRDEKMPIFLIFLWFCLSWFNFPFVTPSSQPQIIFNLQQGFWQCETGVWGIRSGFPGTRVFRDQKIKCSYDCWLFSPKTRCWKIVFFGFFQFFNIQIKL